MGAGVVVLGLVAGCGQGASLEQDAIARGDERLPMEARMAAFERVMKAMVPGTRERTVYRYLAPETKSRIADDETFSLHIKAPDGTTWWLTLRNGRVWTSR